MENQYYLEDLTINRVRWGDLEGSYTGKISFSNAQKDAFSFTLTEERTKLFIELIADQISADAARLGYDLKESITAQIEQKKTAQEIGMKIDQDGNMRCAKFSNFINLQESQAGFGKTDISV